MSQEPELGQMLFGNPTGGYGTDDYVDALIDALLTAIGKVYWNNNQKQWDCHDDPQIPGMEFRPYCWNDDSPEAEKPNLKFDFSPQEIRWYKHPGRGQSCTMKWDEAGWRTWFDKGMTTILQADSISITH